jgi:hypothetical protein
MVPRSGISPTHQEWEMAYWTEQAPGGRVGGHAHPMAKVHVALGLIALILILALIVLGGNLAV